MITSVVTRLRAVAANPEMKVVRELVTRRIWLVRLSHTINLTQYLGISVVDKQANTGL